MKRILFAAIMALATLFAAPASSQQVGAGCTPIGRGAVNAFFSDCAAVTGTANAIILTPPFGGVPTTPELVRFTRLRFYAASTTTAATTVRYGATGPGPYVVYVNSPIGAVAAIGGEIIAGNPYTLEFDPALNSSTGGWRIVGGVDNSGITGLANPTALVGPTAINGVATTAMRSDSAPAINLASTYNWIAPHTWATSPTFSTSWYSLGKFTIGAIDIPAEFRAQQGGLNAIEGISVGVLVPSSATGVVHGVNAIGAYISSQAGLGFTSGGWVAGYFQAVGTANNANMFSINALAACATGITGCKLQNEFDFNVANATDTVTGVGVVLSGPVQPGLTGGFATFSNNSLKWTTSFSSNNGAATNAFFAGASSTANNSASQPLLFQSISGIGTDLNSEIFADANGSIILTPGATASSVAFQDPSIGVYFAAAYTGITTTANITPSVSGVNLGGSGANQQWSTIFTDRVRLSATSNQLVFQSSGVTGTISWAPTSTNKTITLPNGTTDFTATGGASQVLKQVSAGAAITVARLSCADLSDASTGCSASSGITALTGDVTATGPGSAAATLATAQPAVHTWALAQTFNADIFAPNLPTTTAALGAAVCWTATTGQFQRDTNAGGCLISAAKFKHDFKELSREQSFATVMAAKPYSFVYNDDEVLGQQVGFKADDFVGLEDRLVGRDDKGDVHSFRYQQYTAILTGAIQQLKADNDNLRQEVEQLKRSLR